MGIVFSTNGVHPNDAAAYWSEVVTQSFFNYLIPKNKDEPFRARLHSGFVGSLGVTSYEASPYVGERTTHEVARADHEDFMLCLQLSGRSTVTDRDRDATLRPGEYFLLDTTQPFVSTIKDASHIVSIRVPREKIEAQFGDVSNLTAKVFDGQGTISAMMFGFLTMLSHKLGTLDAGAASKIGDHALDLITLALTTELESGRTSPSSPKAMALMRLKLAVDTQLRDPGLKPAVAAAAAGISVRYANALLAQENTCLERFIIARRLEQCRKTLRDPTQAYRTVSEIAFSWGFTDVSHFNRRFKAAYGCAPGAYRKAPKLIAEAV